jgi:hypothetical protein
MKTRRDRMKRKIAQAANLTIKAASYIAELHDEFNSSHPEHAKLLDLIGQNLMLSVNLIEDFWSYTWNERQSDWDAYRNT